MYSDRPILYSDLRILKIASADSDTFIFVMVIYSLGKYVLSGWLDAITILHPVAPASRSELFAVAVSAESKGDGHQNHLFCMG